MNLVLVLVTIGISVFTCALIRVPRAVIILVGLLISIFAGLFRYEGASLTVLLITLIFLVLYVLFPLLREFVGSAFRIPFRRWLKILLQTALLSSPALLLAAGSIYLSIHIDDWVAEHTIYKMESNASWSCDDNGQRKLVCDEANEGLEVDVNASMSRAFSSLRQDLKNEVRSAVGAADAGSKSGIDSIEMTLFDPANGAIKPSLQEFNPAFRYRVRRCRWYHWLSDTSGCIRRLFMQPMDSAYKSFRANLIANYQVQAAAGLALGDKNGQHLLRTTDDFIEFEIDRLEADAISANSRIFFILTLLSALSVAITTLAATKVVLLIYARHIFDPKTGAQIISFSDRGPRKQAKLKVKDITRGSSSKGSPAFGFTQQLNGKRWYANFSRGAGSDRKGKLGIPRIFKLFLPRLAAGKMFFSSYDNNNTKDDKFGGYGPHDKRFFLITLPPHRRVAIQVENLVAFSEDVEMFSLFDVRLPLLLQHSFYLRVFKGPGQIILSAQGGNASVMTMEDSAAEPFEIIGYDLDGGFSLDVDQGFWSTYFDSHSLLPSDKQSVAIRTTVPTLKKSTSHLAKKLMFFLLPI